MICSHYTSLYSIGQDVGVPFQYIIRRLTVRSREVSKPRRHWYSSLNYRIALQFDRHIVSSAVDVPAKFQSDRTILNIYKSRGFDLLRDLTVSRLFDYRNRAHVEMVHRPYIG